MNASAEIKTMRKDNAISVPVAAVAARLKGVTRPLKMERRIKKSNVTISRKKL